MDPLVHYVSNGLAEGRLPGPLFDGECRKPIQTAKNHSVADRLRPSLFDDPLLRILQENGRFDLNSPYFDPEFYCGRYPDAAPHVHDPVLAYRHFFLVGLAERRQPSAFFDTAYYLDKTPILYEQGRDPLSHYLVFGIEEGKSPSPLFDPRYYCKTCDTGSEKDPFAHYLRHEPDSDNRPCAWFDPVFYRERYLATVDRRDSPLKHYLQQGVGAKAYPNREVAELAAKPLISVVVPVYNVAPAYLNSCIRSVLYQSYPHWELCLADDCSTDPEVRPLLEQWSGTDRRIKITLLSENVGISAATNTAAALATGEYLAFLDNDDELAPEALFTFVRAIAEGADLLYSDEDLIGADGTRFSVFRKPGFNRELLLCHNYVTHCVVAQKVLFDRVGGCAGEMNGAQDHDLFLKLAEHARKITHIPEILYHWRASESSTSINHSQKGYADEAGRKSVAGAFDRRGIAGKVEFTDLKFFYRARRVLPPNPSVSVLVHFRRSFDEFEPWLTRLLSTAGVEVGQLVIAGESRELLEAANKAGTAAGTEIECLMVPPDIGPAAAYNEAIATLRGEFVVLADCFLDAPCDGWLAALLEYAAQEDVGFVGGKVDYPSDLIEVTPIPDCTVTSPSYYARFVANCSILMNGLQCSQEVRSMTGEICLIRTDLLREAGCFRAADFPLLFFVQDLAFRLHLQGRTHIYTPCCAWTMTAARQDDPESRLVLEKERFQRQWSMLLSQGDPFYNTGLLVDRELSLPAFQAWLVGPYANSTHFST